MFLQGSGVAVHSSQWAPDSLVSGQVFASGAPVRQNRRNSVWDGTAGCQRQVCPGILSYSDRSILQIRGDLKCIYDSCVNVREEMKWGDESASKCLLKEGVFEELHKLKWVKMKESWKHLGEENNMLVWWTGWPSFWKEEMQNSKLFFGRVSILKQKHWEYL